MFGIKSPLALARNLNKDFNVAMRQGDSSPPAVNFYTPCSFAAASCHAIAAGPGGELIGALLLQGAVLGEGQKMCRRCRKVQSASDFQVDRHNQDGLQSYCKTWGLPIQPVLASVACSTTATLSVAVHTTQVVNSLLQPIASTTYRQECRAAHLRICDHHCPTSKFSSLRFAGCLTSPGNKTLACALDSIDYQLCQHCE